MAKAINVTVVEENRPSLTSFGALYGKRIFSAIKIPVFTDFGSRTEAAQHNNGVFITRNLNRYKVQAIDITSIALKKGLEDEYEIVINEGITDETGNNSFEVRCPISDSKFTKEVNVDNLTDALNNQGSSSRAFFSTGKKLAEFLNSQNAKEISKANALIADLKSAVGMLEATVDKNTSYTEAYYRQLDGKKSTDVNVHVTVED